MLWFRARHEYLPGERKRYCRTRKFFCNEWANKGPHAALFRRERAKKSLRWWIDYVKLFFMNALSEPFGLPNTAPELARRFAVIMAGLGALVARRFLKMPHLSGFTLLLWGRINRAVRRFHRALTRPAGGVRAARARADRNDVARVRPLALPRGNGWIVRELGWEAAAYMGQLEALLAEVKSRATLAQAPNAMRVLRPICRMLGVAVAVVPVLVREPKDPEVIGTRLEPGALPGVVGDCEVLATCE
jgi:hypothetical protein